MVMSRLNRKLFRDLRFNLSQFIVIFLMVMVGVLAFAGVHSYMDGMRASGDRYYRQNNLADLWLTGENFTSEDLEHVRTLENVRTAERKLTLSSSLKGHGEVTMETNFIESNQISRFHVVSGKAFDSTLDGVWFDAALAGNLDIHAGDHIQYRLQGQDFEKEVLGLIDVPDHVYSIKDETEIFPDHKTFGFMYLSAAQFPGSPQIFNSIMVDVWERSRINETRKLLTDEISTAIAVTGRNSQVSWEGYAREIEEGETYSIVFSFLFLFIAALSVVTTMNRFVRRQRTQIGTLKALGFRRGRITRHYVSYGFWISLIAAATGIFAGELTIGRFFLSMEMGTFTVPEYDTVLKPVVFVMAGSVVIGITLITWFSTRSILRVPAAESLRVERPKIRRTGFRFTTKGPFARAPLPVKWNLRDISRNKGRSLMAIAGIMGCTMLVVCALGMMDTINSYIHLEYGGLNNFDYKLVLETDCSDEEYQSLAAEYGDTTSETLPVSISFPDGNLQDDNVVTVTDGKDMLRFIDHDRNYITLKDSGVYLTEKLADQLGVQEGDTISWKIMGTDRTYKTEIAGLNRDPQSQQMTMTRQCFESLGESYRADTLYTDADLKNVPEPAGVSKIQSIRDMEKSMTSMISTMMSLVVVLIFISVLLGCVIIYNLGILSFNEKQYQFATLKVLGYRNRIIRKIFVQQNRWLAVIAILLGLPAGYSLTAYIFGAALGEQYDFPAHIELRSYLLAAVGTFLVSWLVNSLMARKIRKIDMVSSMKANE